MFFSHFQGSNGISTKVSLNNNFQAWVDESKSRSQPVSVEDLRIPGLHGRYPCRSVPAIPAGRVFFCKKEPPCVKSFTQKSLKDMSCHGGQTSINTFDGDVQALFLNSSSKLWNCPNCSGISPGGKLDKSSGGGWDMDRFWLLTFKSWLVLPCWSMISQKLLLISLIHCRNFSLSNNLGVLEVFCKIAASFEGTSTFHILVTLHGYPSMWQVVGGFNPLKWIISSNFRVQNTKSLKPPVNTSCW